MRAAGQGQFQARLRWPGQAPWESWHQARASAGPAAERARRRLSEDHHGSESVLLNQHVAALRAAGFAEIGTLWQYGENRILCGIMPG